MKNNKSILALSLTLAATVPSAFAADTDQQNEIIVTASRSEQNPNEVLASSTVIDRSQIEASQTHDLSELLRLEAGIDITRNGGPGSTTSVFLRGTNNKHTLVLIDGVRVSSASTGAFAWENLSTANIEKIEIVRGPRASLYGSDAIGGVISITTRKASGASVFLEAGSYGTLNSQLTLAGGSKIKYKLVVDKQDSEGFSAKNENASYGYNPDKDGRSSLGVNGSLQATLSDTSLLDLNLWSNLAKSEYDQGSVDSTNQAVSLKYEAQLSNSWTHSLTLGNAIDTAVYDSSSPSDISTYRNSLSWQNNIDLSDTLELAAGIDYVDESAKSINLKTTPATIRFDKAVQNTALFANLNQASGANSYQLSARSDSNTQFGSYSTAQLAWGRKLGENRRLFISHGTGFKAPTLNNLYYPGTTYAGNPDLQPETSVSTELGMRFGAIKVNLYDTVITNLIAYEGTNYQAINIGKAEITGVELVHSKSSGAWNRQFTFTAQNAMDLASNEKLDRRPDYKLSWQATRKLPTGYLRGELLYASERSDGSNTLKPYTVFNLASSQNIGQQQKISLRIDNLFNEQYELAYGYNTPGQSFYLGYEYRIK